MVELTHEGDELHAETLEFQGRKIVIARDGTRASVTKTAFAQIRKGAAEKPLQLKWPQGR